MMFAGIIDSIPVRFIYWTCGTLLSVVSGVVVYVAKHVYSKVVETKTQIVDISSELTLQRTNCLSTLQAQGYKQIDILERIAESVSYLKGKNDAS